jgi:hypothetical protein
LREGAIERLREGAIEREREKECDVPKDRSPKQKYMKHEDK